MNMKTILKTSVAAAALMAISVPAMATIENAQPKVKLKVYGQVNKAMLWGDDGKNDRVMVVDNAASTTRFGFLADAPVNADFSFGANLEWEFSTNDSVQIAITNTTAFASTGNPDNTRSDAALIKRKADVTMTHKRFGKVSLGHGDEASESLSDSNQTSATDFIGITADSSYLGNTALTNSSAADAYTAVALGTHIGTMDGGRDDRVRYDTPRFMGLAGQASFTSGGGGAVGATYLNKLGAFNVDARVGYGNLSGLNTTIEEYIAGSISVLHDSGVNAYFVAAKKGAKNTTAIAGGLDRNNGDMISGGVGYIAKIFGVGPTAFAGSYANYDNFALNITQGEFEVDTWTIGVQQNFSDIGATAYLAYRNYSIDAPKVTPLVSYDDINMVLAGVKVTF